MSRRGHRSMYYRRALRSDALRMLLIVLISPMLVLGAFGGTTILAHRHHGHPTHWHAGTSRQAAINLASAHIARHNSVARDTTARTGCGERAEHHADVTSSAPHHTVLQSAQPGGPADDTGLIITIPEHDQLTRRASNFIQNDTTPAPVHAVAFVLLVSHALTEGRSRDCHGCGPPRHLCALTPSARLQLTSRAMLL